jgi:hypothetical protein
MSWNYDDWDHSGDYSGDHSGGCCDRHHHRCPRRKRRSDLELICKVVRRRPLIPIGRVTLDCTPVTFDSRKGKHCW